MYLLFDIGGTNTRIAVSGDGKVLENTQTFPTQKSFEQATIAIKRVADQLKGGEKIQAAAGGIAGVLDNSKSLLLKSPNLPGWVNKPLKTIFEEIFDTSVKLENDVALEGLGETCFGTYKDKEIIAYIAVGTGVGGVRIVKGQIDHNSQGFEPGHQIIVPDGKPCNCGGQGHLEAYVGGAYLTDPISWEEVTKYLPIGLHNMIVCWSPDIVILGGGVAKNIPMEKLTENLRQLLTIFPKVPQIVLASLGEERGLYGALKHLKPKI